MQFSELVSASQEVTATRARLLKIERLARLLAELRADEVEIAVGMLTGEPRQGRLGIGGALLQRCSPVAASASSLSLDDVDRALSRLGSTKGVGSSAERQRSLGEVLARATHDEQDFLRRLLVGELRQGALEGVLVDAVARAASLGPALIRRAVLFAGGLGEVARAALFGGERALSEFGLQLFRPLAPMLADSAGTLDDALNGEAPLAFEYKFDGARIQVHRSGSDVRVFSRQGNDVTDSVPEVVALAQSLPARELVLDGEAIALAADGRPEAFQTTMRRFGRRLEVAALQKQWPLSCFFFDCLQVDGQLLVDEPYVARVGVLAERVPEAARVARLVTSELSQARDFLEASLAAGHEGVLAKALDSPYEAGRRGAGWLKVKPAHTLDLVVLAAEWGHGRRSAWLSNLHLGARDPERGGFVMLGKTFKGLTDATLVWQTQQLGKLRVAESGGIVHVKPELVVEIALDGLQTSSRYPGGLALRFARVKRYRPDKRAEDADTIATVRALYETQRTGSSQAAPIGE